MIPVSSEIYKGCLKHSHRCQKQLYEHCYPDMVKLCLRYCDGNHDATALYNESMFKVFRNMHTVQSSQQLMSWIRKIVVHTCIDECRKKVKYVVLPGDDFVMDKGIINPSIYQKISASEIMDLLKTLPRNTSLVFNLHALDGYHHSEIAEMLGISSGTSKWHVSEARKLLKQKLEHLSKNKIYSNVI